MAIERSTASAAAPTASELPLCFVVSPIGPEDSDARKIADKVLKHVIAKALSERYEVQRGDEIAKLGLIAPHVVERLLEAPLVVADLSDGNANVYYELGIRHAEDKPVIHIIADGQDAPFDVKDMDIISYNLKDLDSVDRAREKIRLQASAIEKGAKPITPVQVAQILAQPPAGGKEQMLQAIYNAIAGLQQEVRETKQLVQVLDNALLMQTYQQTKAAVAGRVARIVVPPSNPNKGYRTPPRVAPKPAEEPPSKDSPAEKEP